MIIVVVLVRVLVRVLALVLALVLVLVLALVAGDALNFAAAALRDDPEIRRAQAPEPVAYV